MGSSPRLGRGDALNIEREATTANLLYAQENLQTAQSNYDAVVLNHSERITEAETAVRQAELALQQAQLGKSIVAPIDGTIMSISGHIGE